MDEKQIIIQSKNKKPFKLPNIQKEYWCDFRIDYEAGMTLKAIAEKYFCDPRTIRQCIIENKSSDELGKQMKPTKLAPYYQQVEDLYYWHVDSGSPAFAGNKGICKISREITEVLKTYGYTGSERTVRNYLKNKYQTIRDLPYKRAVYDLEGKNTNAKRMQRRRKNLNVIFDMDGVIFDSERFYIECHVIAAKKVGLDGMEHAAYQYIGLTEKETEKKLRKDYGMNAPIEEFLKETRIIFREQYNKFGLPLKEGVIELLQFLQKNHAKIAIASSTEVGFVKTELRDAGLIDFFNVIVGGNMVEASKPEPDIFFRAAKNLRRDIKDCYIIEDSFNGIRAAYKAGGKVFMVPDLVQPTEEIRMLTDRIFKSLVDVQEYFRGI